MCSEAGLTSGGEGLGTGGMGRQEPHENLRTTQSPEFKSALVPCSGSGWSLAGWAVRIGYRMGGCVWHQGRALSNVI